MEEIKCSFCNKSNNEVEFMFNHDIAKISLCSECIYACNEIILRERIKKLKLTLVIK